MVYSSGTAPIRLAGATAGVNASTGYAWSPTHGPLRLTLRPGDTLAAAGAGTQSLEILAQPDT